MTKPLILAPMYNAFPKGRSRLRHAAFFVALLFLAGLLFLHLWLNTRVLMARRELSEAALEAKRLETELSTLEYRVEEAFSPETLMRLVEELNEEARLKGEPVLVPLKGDQIILLPGDGKGDHG